MLQVKEHKSIIHSKHSEFFESPSGSSSHGRQIPAVAARVKKPPTPEEKQPTRGRSKRYQDTPQEIVLVISLHLYYEVSYIGL